jgi:hypothetical protein
MLVYSKKLLITSLVLFYYFLVNVFFINFCWTNEKTPSIIYGSRVDPTVLVLIPESPEKINSGTTWLKMSLKRYFLSLGYALTDSSIEKKASDKLIRFRESIQIKSADDFFNSPMSTDPPDQTFFENIIEETGASLVVWSRLKGYKANRVHDETWVRFSSSSKYSWVDLFFNPGNIGGKLYCSVAAAIVLWDSKKGLICNDFVSVRGETAFFGSFRSRMEALRRSMDKLVVKALKNYF